MEVCAFSELNGGSNLAVEYYEVWPRVGRQRTRPFVVDFDINQQRNRSSEKKCSKCANLIVSFVRFSCYCPSATELLRCRAGLAFGLGSENLKHDW